MEIFGLEGTDRGRIPYYYLLSCVLAALTLTGASAAGVPVFRPEARCWGGVTTVGVNQSRGDPYDCGGQPGSLANQTCSDLEVVLLSIADSITSSTEPFSCIEVVIHPGTYMINSTISITNQSVIIRGVGGVLVTFNSSTFDPTRTLDPYYIMQLSGLDYAEIYGIEFSGSPGIVGLENISTVVVSDCSFSYFYQGALDIYESDIVYVSNCTFEHNGPASILKPQQYRGHAGGLSIGTEEESTNGTTDIHFMVTGCTFRNNTSITSQDDLEATTRLVMTLLFPGRGGGCSIVVNTTSPANATINNCSFEGNGATSFGGGIYLGFSGYSTHSITVINTRFVRNRSNSAGGLMYSFTPDGLEQGDYVTLVVLNSEFVENSARFGGGVCILSAGQTTPDGRLTHFAHIEKCTFIGNSADEFGAAMAASTLLFLDYTGGITPLEIVDCTYINNMAGSSGTVSTAYFPLSFLGVNIFKGSFGRVLVVLGTQVEMRGDMQFVDNGRGVTNDIALYLTSLAQIKLFEGATFLFEGNTGAIGAGIEVRNHHVPPVFSQLAFNPLCPFIYQNISQSPDTWDVIMNFTGNRAIYASAVFLNNINLCSWVQLRQPSFDVNRVFQWNFTTLSDNCNSAHYPDDCNPTYAIQTPPVRINILRDELLAYPGAKLSIPLRTFDEFNKSAASPLRLSTGDVDLMFSPSVVLFDQISRASVSIELAAVAEEVTASRQASRVIRVETPLVEVERNSNFSLVVTDCPPGYVLSAITQLEGFVTCECDFDNPIIIDCVGENIHLEFGLWGARGSNPDHLVTHPCPPQYCRCQQNSNPTRLDSANFCAFIFNSQAPDLQCACDRKGLLCGECKDNRGVSVLLNYCDTCENASGLLVVALVIADIVALVGLFLIKAPPPDFVYPCIFYLQMIPFLAAFFPVTFEKLHPFLYYISSALSLYFVYDFCIYENMDPLVSYFLKYLPLFTSLITGTIFVAIRYCYSKHRVRWHGLWWVILLQYTHVVYTSMSILNCPNIGSQSSTGSSSWFVNGNINCFHGWHAPLGILAILTLVFCVFIVAIILLYAFKWLKRPWWIRTSIEPLNEGIGSKYRIWPALELGRRLLLLLFIVAFPGNDYPAIFILMVFVAAYGYLQPYKHLLTNILEIVLCINVLTMLLLRNTKKLTDVFQALQEQGGQIEDECNDEFVGVTDLAILLGTFYYFPLVVFLVVTAVWVFVRLRKYNKAKWEQRKRRDSDPTEMEYFQHLDSARASTTTVTMSMHETYDN